MTLESSVGTAGVRYPLLTVVFPIDVCILSRRKRLEFRPKPLREEYIGTWIALSSSRPGTRAKREMSKAVKESMNDQYTGRENHKGKLVGFVKFGRSIPISLALKRYKKKHSFTAFEKTKDWVWPVSEVMRLDDSQIFKTRGTLSAPGLVDIAHTQNVKNVLDECLVARRIRKAQRRARKRFAKKYS